MTEESKTYTMLPGFVLRHPTTEAIHTSEKNPDVRLNAEEYALCSHMVEEKLKAK